MTPRSREQRRCTQSKMCVRRCARVKNKTKEPEEAWNKVQKRVVEAMTRGGRQQRWCKRGRSICRGWRWRGSSLILRRLGCTCGAAADNTLCRREGWRSSGAVVAASIQNVLSCAGLSAGVRHTLRQVSESAREHMPRRVANTTGESSN